MNTAFSLRRPALTLFLGAALLLAGCGGAPSGGSGDPNLALIHQVMTKVQASYVEPVDGAQLTKDSLKGMLTGLDPHSDYMDENEYEEMLADSHGEFTGIGAELTRDELISRSSRRSTTRPRRSPASGPAT